MNATPSGASARRLLVVEDEAVQRALAVVAATRLGFVAEGAATLAAAIGRVNEIPWDAVVIDLGIGGHDGIELLRALARAGSAAGVILVSAFDERVRHAAARLAAAVGLRVVGSLTKPVMAIDLAALLARLPERTAAGPPEAMAAIDARALAGAIARDEIDCYYQPKLALATRQVLGLEVLARWRSPDGGFIPPDQFIPLAEREGLIDELTHRILRRALARFAAWRRSHPGLTLAVNLSPASLTDLRLPDLVCEALARAAVPPSALVMEVTESGVMTDMVAAADILTRLRIRGVKLSIDDFGTGHASLLSLLRLPFSELKIDKTFVRSSMFDPEAAKIVAAIVSLARELGLDLVAEGIETERVARTMTEMGCAVGQGFLFAPALSDAALSARLGSGELAMAS